MRPLFRQPASLPAAHGFPVFFPLRNGDLAIAG